MGWYIVTERLCLDCMFGSLSVVLVTGVFISLKVVEEAQSSEVEKKAEEEVYRCPVCFKEFVCKYGLETHMETHPDTSLR